MAQCRFNRESKKHSKNNLLILREKGKHRLASQSVLNFDVCIQECLQQGAAWSNEPGARRRHHSGFTYSVPDQRWKNRSAGHLGQDESGGKVVKEPRPFFFFCSFAFFLFVYGRVWDACALALSSTYPSAPWSHVWWCGHTAGPPGRGHTRPARSPAGCSSWKVKSSLERPGLQNLQLGPPEIENKPHTD